MTSIWWMPVSLREVLHRVLQHQHQQTPSSEDEVGLLDDEKEAAQPSAGRSSRISWTWRTWLMVGLTGALLVVAALLLSSGKRVSIVKRPWHAASGRPEDPMQQDHYLHIAIPIQEESVEVCKTLLTGAVLDYPTSWVLPWNNTLDANDKVVNGTLSKLQALSAWLDKLPTKKDNDTVAILNNQDSWFQVRPEVLVKRYFNILEAGTKRLHKSFDPESLAVRNITTKIVFATDKDCPSPTANGTACLVASASDKSPHYLSASFAIGRQGDMRELWKHAIALAASNPTLDEHSVFAHIFNEQELRRANVRQTAHLNSHVKTSKQTRRDFGIELDVRRELSYAVPHDVDDVTWVSRPAEKKKGSPAALDKDIAASMPPFWSVTGTSLPADKTWANVPLLTSAEDNVVPAIVQRGPGFSPALAKAWWEKLWFQPHGRLLLDSFALTPLAPVAIVVDPRGVEQRFWSRNWQKVGFKTGDAEFHKWTAVCGTEQDASDVFLDDRGPWEDPRP